MGLDLEPIDEAKSEVLKSQMTSDDLGFLPDTTASEITGLTIMWSAKEALSKIFMFGLTCPFQPWPSVLYTKTRITTKEST
jgi:4'-phosphopantetheinyl transferase EntD